MNYNITGKHLDISDAVRSYVEEKLGKLEIQQITSAQITLRAENHLKFAEATLHLASGKTIHGDASHEDMYVLLIYWQTCWTSRFASTRNKSASIVNA